MKKIQGIIALPSILLLCVSLFFDLDYLLYLSLAGFLLAMVVKQLRLRNRMFEMGHPDRNLDRHEDGDEGDLEIDVSGDD
ncbi:hypothetical protein [Rossellomorea aquimaris]|uniref:Uncharacterized protein n=1 Tax=Rossellomorea aquimaris TaxID=189382 RepID=A0A366EXH8_9BACI|nr:hypothetical protein [Rossellomorea aquimaris]RBP06209.1 hypothetical protein DET59_103341 [Rossellomorea aquimaris]